MSLEDKHAITFGKLIIQANSLMQQVEDLDAALSCSYELLAQCIRSDQCSAAQVEVIMKDQVFARWYEQHYPLPAPVNQGVQT